MMEKDMPYKNTQGELQILNQADFTTKMLLETNKKIS